MQAKGSRYGGGGCNSAEHLAFSLLGVKQIAEALERKSGTKGKSEYRGNKRVMADRLIRDGFDVSAIRHVKQSLQITEKEMSDLIGISSRTMHRKLKAGGRLDLITSDRLYRVAYIFGSAFFIFI